MHKAPDVINELLSISPQSINKVHKITKNILIPISPNSKEQFFSYAKYLKSRKIKTATPAYKRSAVAIKIYFQISPPASYFSTHFSFEFYRKL